MARRFVFLGCLSAGLAVLLGAFGAHYLKHQLASSSLATFQTGVHYHMYHSLGLLAIGLGSDLLPRPALAARAGWSMLAGIVLFPGSLYVLSISGIKAVGFVTPVGGVLFVVSWALLAISAIRPGDGRPSGMNEGGEGRNRSPRHGV